MSKFFQNNKDIFLQYFEDCGQWSASQVYDFMIQAGDFKKMQEVIRSKSSFDFNSWVNNFIGK